MRKISSHQTLTTKRHLWPDVLRIIAIYLVINVHASVAAGSLLGRLDVLGVPFFMMLSGALLLGKAEPYTTFFQKRFLKVGLPWLVWTCVYMGYILMFRSGWVTDHYFSAETSLAIGWLHFFITTLFSNLWFLPMILGVYALTPLLRIIVAHASRIDLRYVLGLWFVTFSLLPYVVRTSLFPTWEPSLWFLPLQMSGYFLLGYVLSNRSVLDRVKLGWLAVAGLAPFFVMNSVQSSAYLFPSVVVSAALLFHVLVRFLSTSTSAISFKQNILISRVSGATLGIYILHEMFLDYFGPILQLFLHPIHGEFLVTPITFVATLGVVLVLQKVPLVKMTLP